MLWIGRGKRFAAMDAFIVSWLTKRAVSRSTHACKIARHRGSNISSRQIQSLPISFWSTRTLRFVLLLQSLQTSFFFPRRFLLRLRDDPHREVRLRVASHVEGEELVPMMSDPDYYVRKVVAQRIGLTLLKNMIDDPDPEVRRVVAVRIGVEWLPELIDDPDTTVTLAVAARLSPSQLLPLRFHPDFRVRYEAAGRVPLGALAAMQQDEDPMVRERVQERIAERYTSSSTGEHLLIQMNPIGREGRRS